jgi:hypothetical protein
MISASGRRDGFPVSRGHLPGMSFRHTPDFFPMTPEDQNRIAIDPDWFLIAIMIAIAFSKPGSGYEMKIADRF